MTATASPPSAAAATTPVDRPTVHPLRVVVDALGSMKLTVVLIVLLAILTWTGTLAQTVDGIYYVQKQYFESWIVLARIPILDWRILWIPLPGAVPVLGLLFVNLILGGILRIRWGLRTAGIVIAHIGIALLLLAGGVKLSNSFAGHLSLQEGATGNSIRSFQDWELALLWQEGDKVMERTVPGATIERATGQAGLQLTGDGLPFSLQVNHFLEHCQPMPKGPMFQTATPVVDGVVLMADREMGRNGGPRDRDSKLAGCYVTVLDGKGGKGKQGILWAADLLPANVVGPHRPWTFEAGGRTYGLELRHRLWNLPFDVKLDRFQKSEHPGTMMARDYSSFVTVVERNGNTRPAHIYMNEPLRKDGFVFYQTSFNSDPHNPSRFVSVFEVANNPSDQWPKWACYIIAVGLLLHFAIKLWKFIESENRRRTEKVIA